MKQEWWQGEFTRKLCWAAWTQTQRSSQGSVQPSFPIFNEIWLKTHKHFAGCLLQINVSPSQGSVEGTYTTGGDYTWRSSGRLQQFLSLSYNHHLGFPAGKELLLSCPVLLLRLMAANSRQFGKSCPESDCTCPTGTTVAKRNDRHVNKTAAKKLVCELSQSYLRDIHISSWVKLSGKPLGWHSEICKFALKQQSCPSPYTVHIFKITT